MSDKRKLNELFPAKLTTRLIDQYPSRKAIRVRDVFPYNQPLRSVGGGFLNALNIERVAPVFTPPVPSFTVIYKTYNGFEPEVGTSSNAPPHTIVNSCGILEDTFTLTNTTDGTTYTSLLWSVYNQESMQYLPPGMGQTYTIAPNWPMGSTAVNYIITLTAFWKGGTQGIAYMNLSDCRPVPPGASFSNSTLQSGNISPGPFRPFTNFTTGDTVTLTNTTDPYDQYTTSTWTVVTFSNVNATPVTTTFSTKDLSITPVWIGGAEYLKTYNVTLITTRDLLDSPPTYMRLILQLPPLTSSFANGGTTFSSSTVNLPLLSFDNYVPGTILAFTNESDTYDTTTWTVTLVTTNNTGTTTTTTTYSTEGLSLNPVYTYVETLYVYNISMQIHKYGRDSDVSYMQVRVKPLLVATFVRGSTTSSATTNTPLLTVNNFIPGGTIDLVNTTSTPFDTATWTVTSGSVVTVYNTPNLSFISTILTDDNQTQIGGYLYSVVLYVTKGVVTSANTYMSIQVNFLNVVPLISYNGVTYSGFLQLNELQSVSPYTFTLTDVTPPASWYTSRVFFEVWPGEYGIGTVLQSGFFTGSRTITMPLTTTSQFVRTRSRVEIGGLLFRHSDVSLFETLISALFTYNTTSLSGSTAFSPSVILGALNPGTSFTLTNTSVAFDTCLWTITKTASAPGQANVITTSTATTTNLTITPAYGRFQSGHVYDVQLQVTKNGVTSLSAYMKLNVVFNIIPSVLTYNGVNYTGNPPNKSITQVQTVKKADFVVTNNSVVSGLYTTNLNMQAYNSTNLTSPVRLFAPIASGSTYTMTLSKTVTYQLIYNVQVFWNGIPMSYVNLTMNETYT